MSGTDKPELERALLGAVLVAPELLGAAAEHVDPTDFAHQGHGVVWEALLRLDEDDRPLDLVTLKAELGEMRQLEAVGGAAYLAGLLDGVPRVGEGAVTDWARKLREAARLRRSIASLRETLRLAESGELTADELQGSLERAVGDAPSGMAVLPRADVAADAWAAIEAEVHGKADGIPTGLPALDMRIRFGGWRP
jgi:replicative DNA helicase